MIKKLSAVCLLLSLCLGANAQQIVTATVTVTNTSGTTNGQTITINGSTRTFTNNLTSYSSQVLTGATITVAASNIFVSFVSAPAANTFCRTNSTNQVIWTSYLGQALSASISANWGTVTLATNTVTSTWPVLVPQASLGGAAAQTNILSLLALELDSGVITNALHESSPFAQNLVGITNAQTITGNKTFTGTNIFSNSASIFYNGTISNAAGISGTIKSVTNGLWRSGFLSAPSFTNAVAYNDGGDSFYSMGNTLTDEAYGNGARADGGGSLAVGRNASALFGASTAIGPGAQAEAFASIAIGNSSVAVNVNDVAIGITAQAAGTNSIAIGRNANVNPGHINSMALGYNSSTTASNQMRIGYGSTSVSIPGGLQVEGTLTNAHFGGTNTFPAGSDISFGRYSVTLANGNNVLHPGTNVLIEVTGPSGAFTNAAIDAQPNRDGDLKIILNQTGQNMAFAHNSGFDGTAANHITCLTGADKSVTGNSSAIVIYSGAASRWIVLYFGQ